MWGAFELSSVEATEPATLPVGYKALDGIFQALGMLPWETSALERTNATMQPCVAEDSASLLSTNCHKHYLSCIVRAPSDNAIAGRANHSTSYHDGGIPFLAIDRQCGSLTRSNSIFQLFQYRSPSGMAHLRTLHPEHFLTSSSKTDSTQKQLEGSRDSEVECHGAPRAKGTFKWAYCRHVYEQICSQLNHDLWWIALAVICITVAEGDHYRSQPLDYSTFNIIFEVVSACSCIGVSIGYPGKTYSFCGEWHTFSKLVLAGVALRGKHRGVPLAIDNGLLLREAQDWIQNYPT